MRKSNVDYFTLDLSLTMKKKVAMSTFLLLWNPRDFSWKLPNTQNEDMEDDIQTIKMTGTVSRRWSCGRVTKAINVGDRIFLIKIGKNHPKGIVAAGIANSKPFSSEHYSTPNKVAWYITVGFDCILNPFSQPTLLLSELQKINNTDKFWTPLSAKSINEDAIALEKLWANHLSSIAH